MNKMIFIGMALCLTGCATEGKFREQLETWVGADSNNLIMRMGPPESTYEMPNGVKLLTWMNSGGYLATSSYNPYSRTAFGVSGPIYCKVTFTVTPIGTVTGYRYEGNNCVSKEGAPDRRIAAPSPVRSGLGAGG